MERETKMLVWTIFAISAMTFGVIPASWNVTKKSTSQGVKSSANLSQTLWSKSQPLSPTVQNYLKSTTYNNVAIIPGALDPQIASVQLDTSVWPPNMKVQGYQFGNPTSKTDVPLSLMDTSRGWQTKTASPGVVPQISFWDNTDITLTGLTSYGSSDLSNFSDGLGSWVFAPGDNITVGVTNPQTNKTGTYQFQYPQNAPMPNVSANVVSTLVVGQSTNITGTVSFNGQPLENQVVNITVSEGTLGGVSYQNNNSVHVVSTDSQGNFSISYLAPAQAASVKVSVMSDSVTQNESITVLQPTAYLQVSKNVMQSGETATLTASANVIPSGYLLELIDQGSGQVLNQGTSNPLTFSVSYTDGSTHTYVSKVIDPSGVVVSTSSPAQLKWLLPWTVQLTGESTGQYQFTLHASVNQPISGQGYQEYLAIYDVSTAQWVENKSVGLQLNVNVTLPDTNPNSYKAYVLDVNGDMNSARTSSNEVTLEPGHNTTSQQCTTGTRPVSVYQCSMEQVPVTVMQSQQQCTTVTVTHGTWYSGHWVETGHWVSTGNGTGYWQGSGYWTQGYYAAPYTYTYSQQCSTVQVPVTVYQSQQVCNYVTENQSYTSCTPYTIYVGPQVN